MPAIAQWQRELDDRLTVAVASAGEPEAIRGQEAEHGLSPMLVDTDLALSEAHLTTGTPSAVLIAPGGQIASYVAAGAVEIESLVDRVLSGSSHDTPEGLPIGELAPELALRGLDDEPMPLVDPDGKETLLLFWNPGCGYCREMLPALLRWESDAGDSAPRLLVVSSGAADETAADRLHRRRPRPGSSPPGARSRPAARRWQSSSTPRESRHLWSGVRRASSSPRLRSDLGRACPSRATASFVTGARAAAHARRCLAAGGRYGRGAWAGPQPLVVEATCGPGTEPCSSANGLKLCMPTGGVCCYFSPKTRRCFGLLKGGAGVCCCSGHRVISACATANTTSRAAGASPPRARERGSAGRSAAARARCARTPRRAPAAGGGATACCWKPPPDAGVRRQGMERCWKGSEEARVEVLPRGRGVQERRDEHLRLPRRR